MVAFALVAATVLKGIFDYVGTFLVNYAGFGMITDLRDDLYNAIMRSSAAFFRSTRRALCSRRSSTISRRCSSRCPACWRNSCSSFSLCIYCGAGGFAGRKAGVGAAVVRARDFVFVEKDWPAAYEPQRGAGRTNSPKSRTFCTRRLPATALSKPLAWKDGRWSDSAAAARRLFRANLRVVAAFAISSPLMDILGSVAIALLL